MSPHLMVSSSFGRDVCSLCPRGRRRHRQPHDLTGYPAAAAGRLRRCGRSPPDASQILALVIGDVADDQSGWRSTDCLRWHARPRPYACVVETPGAYRPQPRTYSTRLLLRQPGRWLRRRATLLAHSRRPLDPVMPATLLAAATSAIPRVAFLAICS